MEPRLRKGVGEMSHYYRDNVRIIDDVFATSLLALFSAKSTSSVQVRKLIEPLYRTLTSRMLEAFGAKRTYDVETRMDQMLIVHGLDEDQNFVVCDIERAGNKPTAVVFAELERFFQNVRRDSIIADRVVDKAHRVIGCKISGAKIGPKPIKPTTLVIADPMGATGGTTLEVLRHYEALYGDLSIFREIVMLHLIIAPEYIRAVHGAFPNVRIMTLRLDRGMSSDRALKAQPGQYPNEERGMTETSYIVPGAGDIGEHSSGSVI